MEKMILSKTAAGVTNASKALPQMPRAPVPRVKSVERSPSGTLIDGLSQLSPKDMLDEKRLAHVLHVSTRTIRRMVERDEIPPPMPTGNRSFWIVGNLTAYFEARAETLAKERQRHAAKRPNL